MNDDLSSHDALALLDWQIELGADEAIGDDPVDRFAVEQASKSAQDPAAGATQPAAQPAAQPAGTRQRRAPDLAQAPVAAPDGLDAVALANEAAGEARDLPALRVALESFQHCGLRDTARNLVFSDGTPGARVMVVGEAPGREEDRSGKPFIGPAGKLLDRMLAAIGLDRMSHDPANAVYITNMLPWRPPQNRDPTAEELAMLAPFVRRHIELADPDILILMGNAACIGLLGQGGIKRIRGEWSEVLGRPAMPTFHPSYLLHKPHEKSKAWADLLSVQARLKGR